MSGAGIALVVFVTLLPWLGTAELYRLRSSQAHDFLVVSVLWTCFVVAVVAIKFFGA